jgi:hypothetical protein
LHLRAGWQVQDLDLIVLTGCLILRGQASTCHAKQLNQYVADRVSGRPVLVNEIAVV